MRLPTYYDQHGRPMTFGEWVVAFENVEGRRVKATDLPDGRHLSTVWLGLNHAPPGEPLQIFETMLFDAEGQSVETWRWSTLDEAVVGHRDLVHELGGRT